MQVVMSPLKKEVFIIYSTSNFIKFSLLVGLIYSCQDKNHLKLIKKDGGRIKIRIFMSKVNHSHLL